MDAEIKKSIKEILFRCIRNTIIRTEKKKKTIDHKPFHEALLSQHIITASSIERSFSTSFGQGPIEEISMILAIASGAESIRQYRSQVNINQGAVDEIERILSSLDSNDATPNWKRETSKISAFKKGNFVVRDVISDLWIKKNGIESFLSIKTVKPNKDQTQIAKRNMLMLKAHNPNFQTYFGLYYNPYGDTKLDYKWSIPFKFFDMKTDKCVLIGKEYWDFIGGVGTYEQLLKIFGEVGNETRDMINNLL